MFGQWRNALESLKYSWPFFGYDQRQWAGSMLAAATSQTGLTEIVRTVLCGSVPVILLYGLPYVEMVETSQGTASIFPNPAKQLQAIILYPFRRRCSSFDNKFFDCLYYIVGLVSTFRNHSSNAVPKSNCETKFKSKSLGLSHRRPFAYLRCLGLKEQC